MELKQSNTLQSLKEVQKFLDDHAAELPSIATTGMRKKFDDTVREITKLAATQTSADLAAQSATQKVGIATQELISHHMSHVARIAKVELPPGPEIAPLGLPKRNLTGERLAARARGMATQAEKFESTFVGAGLPADFIQQLRDAADALSGLITERKQNVADRGAATALLKTNIREVRKVVKVLDGFVRTAAKDNSKLLVTWGILKRLRQASASLPAAPAGDPPFDAIGGAA